MEAHTLHCQSCGAAVGERDLTCPYCGGQLATVACPQCFSMVPVHASHCPNCGTAIAAVATVASALDCPDCRVPLGATTLGGLALDLCGKCGGLWVDQKTFEQIAADRQERGEVMGSLPAAAVARSVTLETVHYRPCPRCARLMNRQNYAHISGVVINVCKEHGIWFERDELRQVLAFIDGGGLERSRTRELTQLTEERHLAAAVPLPPVNADWAGFGSEHPASASLTSIVESLVGHFFH